jgi:hypothetical protein
MSARPAKLLAILLLILLAPPLAATAQELRYLQVE